MALNIPVFFTRLGTAAVFCAVMLLGLCTNEYAFMGLFFVIHLLALHEYGTIVEKMLYTTFSRNEKMSYLLVGVSVFLFISSLPFLTVGKPLFAFLQFNFYYFLGLVIGSSILFFVFAKNKLAKNLLTGIGYISLSFGLLVKLYVFNASLPLIIILLIWCNDTFAYLVGSFIGRTKFVPTISPNKTLEGTLGGIILTVGGSFVLQHYYGYYTTVHWVCIALIVGIAGTIGDLIESKLKRMADVKDSGSLMPGHGGAFDRFDSLIFVIPFIFLYTILFLQH